MARQVGCSAITLRKLEAEERRPSRQIAERLADVLQLAPEDRPAFWRFARGDPFASPTDSKTASPALPQPAPHHNLPLQLTSFIGREKEIAEIRRLLSPPGTARLLTLTGPGGSGKTRLALQVAAGVLDDFPDGVWLVELAPLADPALVPQTVAVVMGLKEVPGRTVTDVLVDRLRAKRLLLVLDNCEHLVRACAELAERLPQACPHLTVLATSRELLGVAGERPVYVPSLSTPEPQAALSAENAIDFEAVRLFVERAAAGAPGFALTGENVPAVAEICRRLDGIPLAIELAAARLRMMPVEQIAARLATHDRFRLLTGGSRTALPRHQTLEALIDWSYELLTEAEQALLRRLAVFSGGWTLEAAEAVGGGDGVAAANVFDLLSRLIDKSLVLVDAPAPGGLARYRMLETIRQYALAKLGAGAEAAAVRRRHAAYYLALAEAGGPNHFYDTYQLAWLDRMRTQLDNVRAALAWSLGAVGGARDGLRLANLVFQGSGSLSFGREGRYWLERALAHLEAENYPEARAGLLWGLGWILATQGEYAAGEAKMVSSLQLVRELGDRRACASVLNRLGWLARERGDTTTARLRLEESVALCRELGDTLGLAWSLVTLGEVGVMLEDVALATAVLEEGLTKYRELGRIEGPAWALNHLGHVTQLKGDYSRARQMHEESLQLFQNSVAGQVGICESNQSLGEIALAQGQAALAATHFSQALNLSRDLDFRSCQAWCLAGLASVAALNEEPERAAWLWGAAEALRKSIGVRDAPVSRATRERLMAAARNQLGEAAFAAAWAVGQAMTIEQAVAEALSST